MEKFECTQSRASGFMSQDWAEKIPEDYLQRSEGSKRTEGRKWVKAAPLSPFLFTGCWNSGFPKWVR